MNEVRYLTCRYPAVKAEVVGHIVGEEEKEDVPCQYEPEITGFNEGVHKKRLPLVLLFYH